MRVRPITCSDGYRFWVDLCPHLVGKDCDPQYDYACRCCGNLIGPLWLVKGLCDRCRDHR